MKLLYPDRTLTAVADEEDESYPDDNVLTDRIKQVWKATSKDAQLVITAAANTNAVGIFNTTAETVQVTIRNLADDTTLWGPSANYDLTSSTYVYGLMSDVSTDKGRDIIIEYDLQAASCLVKIDFAMAAGTVECGVARVGYIREVYGPLYGIQQGLIDKSISLELNSGGLYYKKRDVVRQFSISFRDSLNPNIYQFLRIAQIIGSDLYPWLITDATKTNWCTFARLEIVTLVAIHDGPSCSVVNVKLIEDL